MNTIEEHSVFITSTGRTATQFFAKSLSVMVENCTAFHEPGTLWLSKPGKWAQQTKQFGLYAMTVGQMSKKHCMFKLSNYRYNGYIDDEEVAKYIYNMRKSFIDDLDHGLYIESSGHIYALLDVMDKVFINSKYIFIIRDPRTWIQSALTTFEYILYGPIDLPFLRLSPKAKDIPNDPYKDEWKNMSKFEMYCWFYTRLNEFVLKSMEGKDNFKIYKFEDLFASEKKEEYFRDMLEFISTYKDGKQEKIKLKKELLKEKKHSNADKYTSWKKWSPDKAKILQKHCGELMKRFGYGDEQEWLDLINR